MGRKEERKKKREREKKKNLASHHKIMMRRTNSKHQPINFMVLVLHFLQNFKDIVIFVHIEESF